MTDVTCGDCGYDPAHYTKDDRAGTLRAAEPWWEQLLLNGGADVVSPGTVWDAADPVHNLVHGVRVASRVLHKNGVRPTGGEGSVAGLHVSGGGVPKRPVSRVDVGVRGVVGDVQRTRRHHGRPWQAVCLWSSDVIDRLAAEGHPIGPGSAGENVTISGIDWAELRSGVRLEIGSVLVETSVWSLPCTKNAQWFVDGDFNRMHHERERGVSRMYAWVVEPGQIGVGDPVVVEP
jgi:hypothetical protein